MKREIISIIKLLIYKETTSLLEKLDIENDDVFLEPLLFSYFNSKKDNLFPEEILDEVLQGYFLKRKKLKINYSFNNDGVAFIPKLGYFKKGENSPFEPILMLEDFTVLKETATQIIF